MSFLIKRKVILSVFANYLFLIEPLTPADQRRLILQATEARLGIPVSEPSPGPSSSAVGNEAVVVKTEGGYFYLGPWVTARFK